MIKQNQFIGLDVDELNKLGIYYRISVRDGKSYAITADWKPDRLNVEIRNDKIVKAYYG